jgi:hypothetical protein
MVRFASARDVSISPVHVHIWYMSISKEVAT